MKKAILLLISCFLVIEAYAQDSTSYRSSIKVMYGSAAPTGEFGENRFENDYPPFAAFGSMLSLSYSYSIKPKLQVGGTVALRRNGFEETEFANPNDRIVGTIESEAWQSVFTMADVQYKWYARDGFFYVKGGAGLSFNRSLSYKVQTLFGPINRPTDNSTALAYGINTGMQFDIKRVGLGFDGGWLATSPTFSITDAHGKTTKYKQPMATINLSFYLAYSL